MSKFATIYVLTYGTDFKLHLRCLDSIFCHAPMYEVDIHVWCNAVGEQTKVLLRGATRRGLPVTYYFSEENVRKYKVMRKLFHESAKPETPWIIWFDDDSFIDNHNWWSQTKHKIEHTSNCCYLGQRWYVHHLPGQWEFITEATWFKNKPPEMCPTRRRDIKKPGISFAQGAYWWLRTDVMKQIDWPDPRLNHNGGDTLLGEAIRQQGLPFTNYDYGVAINKARRRGFHEKPAGSLKNTRR